jgi:hypothetical protein
VVKQTDRDVEVMLMTPMDSDPREHLRQAIDAEIESMKESIRESESVRALRQRRNTLALISTLPTETIDDILLHASANRGDSGLAWLRVAHVCRRWRDIALNQPLFWSQINFTNVTLAGAAEMLARAKNAPLHLEATVTHWDTPRYSALVNEIWAHISHIHRLSIIDSDATIISYRELYFDDLKVRKLLHGITPTLSFLELHDIDISWKSSFLTGLRYLKLYTMNMYLRPTLVEWLDALDNMPRLKQLVLHSASPIAPPFTFDVRRTVTLPFLTHLDISTAAKDCALSLAHLVLPALTSLCVTVKYSFNIDVALNLLPYVTQHAHGPQDTQPLQSVICRREGKYVHIAAWPKPGVYVDHQTWSARPELTARVALSINFGFTYTWVLPLAIEALPLDNLVTFTVQPRIRFDEFIWLRLAPRWPQLEHVRLTSKAAPGLRETLLLQDIGGAKSLLFPSLTKLELIEDIALSARRTLRLCSALRRGVEQGVPLKVLDLRTCRGTSSAVRLLGEIVVDVQGPEEPTLWDSAVWDWDPETRGHFVRDEDSGMEWD